MAIPVTYIRRMHMLLNKAGLNTAGDKKSLALEYSQGKTDKTSDLSLEQYKRLIRDLDTVYGRMDAAAKMRRKIISRAHEMSWYKKQPGKPEIDMDRIDRWCSTYGYLHKPLNDYDVYELPKLVSQFDMVYYDFLGKS